MTMQLSEQIFDLLNDINRSPDFYTYQHSSAFFPQLQIDELGELALPLCEAQAQQLITFCNKAPYGKGTQTIVDEKVRKVWELDASNISTGNSAWQDFLRTTLQRCEKRLDLEGQTLIAHPYKLLLYEAGSFFLPHQDSEKEDGMVATLIIALPSAHEGGELVISHRGKSVSIDFSDVTKRYDFQSAFFYADCHHEILPVKEGYRLVLTYNICLKGQRKLNTFDFSAQRKTLSKVFNHWKNSLRTDDEKQLVISLNHQYSEHGFSLNSLKGIDRSRADVLLHAAEKAGCNAYICLIEKYQMYTAWEDDGDPELDELLDDDISIRRLIDSTGKKVNMQLSYINEENILSQVEFDDEDAIEEEYEGYMGNYGNTLSRWYRYAAVILWPQERQLNILAKNSTSAAIAYLKKLHRKKDPHFADNLETLMTMIANKLCSRTDEKFFLLTLVLTQKNEVMAKIYCRYILFTQKSLPSATKINNIIALCSWKYIKEHVNAGNSEQRFRLFELLTKIKKTLDWNKHPALKTLFYDSIEASTNDSGWNSYPFQSFKLIFSLCIELPTKKSASLLTTYLNKKDNRLSAENEILPYLEKQFTHSSPKNRLIFDTISHWLIRKFDPYYQVAKQEPEAALIETIPNINNCNCKDCNEIVNFIRGNAEELELRRLKAGCEHLRKQIIHHKVQVKHSINKKCRPWQFDMRKHGADQRDKIKEYKIAKKYISRLAVCSTRDDLK